MEELVTEESPIKTEQIVYLILTASIEWNEFSKQISFIWA